MARQRGETVGVHALPFRWFRVGKDNDSTPYFYCLDDEDTGWVNYCHDPKRADQMVCQGVRYAEGTLVSLGWKRVSYPYGKAWVFEVEE